MVGLSALEFATSVASICQASSTVDSYNVTIQDNVIVKLRVDVRAGMFVDVFYNAQTEKTSYALIEKGARILGADNTMIGWHFHPFESPDSHVRSESLTFDAFLRMVEEVLARRN